MVPLLLLLPAAGAQSWLTRAERSQAADIQMAFRRPEAELPTCGTSDPGVVQMMMLPAMALGDIMMSHVMHPLMSMFTGHDEAEVAARSEATEEAPEQPAPGRGGRRRVGKTWRGPAQGGERPARSRRARRSISLYSYSPWLTNNIPYVLSPNLNRDDRLTIAKAMDAIEQGSCVSFVPRGFSPYYVHIARECACGSSRCAFNGAYANIGPGALPGLPSRLRILTCLAPNDQDAVGIVTHELLHNMGLLHTHTRQDRHDYVNVNYLNVLPDKWIDYSWNPLQFPLDTDYDCDSIMHYRDTSFNIGNTITLEAVDPSRCRLRSRSNHPTDADIDLINKLYNC